MEASIESGHAIDPRPLAPRVEIVEQEDVAFTLGVCREIHRIYGDYLQGAVSPSDSLEAGLVMTMEMLAVLSNDVNSGMPAMRIGVAASQATEMLAVMFDLNWVQSPIWPKLRERYQALLAEASTSGREIEASAGDSAAGWARWGLARLLRRRSRS